MANSFYNRTYAFAERTLARGTEVKAEFSAVTAAFDLVEQSFESSETNFDLLQSQYDGFVGALSLAISTANQTATSATTLTSGTGTRTLTLDQTGKAFVVGQFVNISSGDATNVMTGRITAFTSGTGVMEVDVQSRQGSSTLSSWIISLSAPIVSESKIPAERTARRAKLAYLNI